MGVDPHGLEKLFEALYTTKAHGMGVGHANSSFNNRESQGRALGDGQRRTGRDIRFLHTLRGGTVINTATIVM